MDQPAQNTPPPRPPQGPAASPRPDQDGTAPARYVQVPPRQAAPIQPPAAAPVPLSPVAPLPSVQSPAMAPTPQPTVTPAQPVIPASQPVTEPVPAPQPPQQQYVAPPSPQVPPQAPTPSPAPVTAHTHPPINAAPTAVASGKRGLWQRWLRPATTFVAFVGFVWGGALLLNAFVFQSYYVEGLSMTPTLQDDDRLIVSKIEHTNAQVRRSAYVPTRGQIVVIDSKVSDFTQVRNEQIIKRVIGLPGETIRINDGTVTIFNTTSPNGFNVDESLGLDLSPTYHEQPVVVQVPNDSVYVLGDNREQGGSYDSREFGPVKTDLLLGRLWVRVLPIRQADVF